MTIQRFLTYCALAAMPMALATSASAQLLIDGFNVGGQVVADQTTGSITQESAFDDGTIMGGERDLYVRGQTPTGVLGVVGTVDDGVLNFSNSPTRLGQAILAYDGDDNNADPFTGVDLVGLGGVDLTDGGELDAFAFTLLFADFQVEYAIGVQDMSGKLANFTGILPTGISGGGDDVEILIPFADMTGDPVDFSNIGVIGLAFTSLEPAADITIDNFRVVPEPSSVALLMAGGVLLARRRRA